MTTMNPPAALGFDYAGVVAIAETIAQQTGLRGLADFEMLVRGMGGRVERLGAAAWAARDARAVDVLGPRSFVVRLAKGSENLDRLMLASALGHYILHAQEGRKPMYFPRFSKDAASLEALWFGMAVVIPDEPFALALAASGIDDATVAALFKAPVELVGLKRKLVAAAGRAAARAAEPPSV